jgi:hypothetical protein
VISIINYIAATVKSHGLLAAILIGALLAPAKTSLVAVMVLPLVDLGLALAVAVKTKQPITSSGLKRTVAKLLMYEVATVLAFITEKYLTGDIVPCMRIVTGLVGITELKSCLEHLDELSGGSFFKAAVNQLTGGDKDAK